MDTVDDIERTYYEALKKLVKLGSWPGTYCGSTSVCPLWNIDPAKYENASEIARLAWRADVAERSAEWLREKLKECQEDTIQMLIILAEEAEREGVSIGQIVDRMVRDARLQVNGGGKLEKTKIHSR